MANNSHEAINIIACDEFAKSNAIIQKHIAKRDEHAAWFQNDCANKANFLLLMSIADCAPALQPSGLALIQRFFLDKEAIISPVSKEDILASKAHMRAIKKLAQKGQVGLESYQVETAINVSEHSITLVLAEDDKTPEKDFL